MNATREEPIRWNRELSNNMLNCAMVTAFFHWITHKIHLFGKSDTWPIRSQSGANEMTAEFTSRISVVTCIYPPQFNTAFTQATLGTMPTVMLKSRNTLRLTGALPRATCDSRRLESHRRETTRANRGPRNCKEVVEPARGKRDGVKERDTEGEGDRVRQRPLHLAISLPSLDPWPQYTRSRDHVSSVSRDPESRGRISIGIFARSCVSARSGWIWRKVERKVTARNAETRRRPKDFTGSRVNQVRGNAGAFTYEALGPRAIVCSLFHRESSVLQVRSRWTIAVRRRALRSII